MLVLPLKPKSKLHPQVIPRVFLFYSPKGFDEIIKDLRILPLKTLTYTILIYYEVMLRLKP